MGMSAEQYKAILNQANEVDLAAIYSSSIGDAAEVRTMTLALDTARLSTAPLDVGFPFKCCYVISATDNSVGINMRLSTQDSYQDVLPLKTQSSLNLPYPVRRAYLDWPAQAGKSITLVFFATGTFSTNQISAINSGGINSLDGNVLSSRAVAGISVTATPSVICPLALTRITETVQNQDSQSIWVGDANVTDNIGANPGLEVPAGASYIHRNTGALYAVSKGTVTKLARLMETN